MNLSSIPLAIALRQHAQSKRAAEFNAESLLFGPQRRAQQCRLKRKIKVCGRRSGKTFEDAVDLLEALAGRLDAGVGVVGLGPGGRTGIVDLPGQRRAIPGILGEQAVARERIAARLLNT